MKPRDMNGNAISTHDSVRLATDKALGDVVDVLAHSFVVVRWPDRTYSKEQATNLRRVNQHPIQPTPMSARG